MLPSVDCIMNTFGRPVWVVEEAIESFLRQDYQGRKRLIIVNDLWCQRFHFDHPEVTIINTDARLPNLGAKYNFNAGHGDGDIIMTWDDDDISLPWRIRTTVEQMAGDHTFFRASQSLYLGEETRFEFHMNYNTLAYSRDLWHNIKKVPETAIPEKAAVNRMAEFHSTHKTIIPYNQTFYIWRKIPGNVHISDMFIKYGSSKCYDAVNYEIERMIDQKLILTGDIYLKPKWRQDYVQLQIDTVAQLKQGLNKNGSYTNK